MKAYIVFFLLVCFFVKVNAETAPVSTSRDVASSAIQKERQALEKATSDLKSDLEFAQTKHRDIDLKIKQLESQLEGEKKESSSVSYVHRFFDVVPMSMSDADLADYKAKEARIAGYETDIGQLKTELSSSEQAVKDAQGAYDKKKEQLSNKSVLSLDEAAKQEVAEINRRISKTNLLMEYSQVMENLNNSDLNLMVMREKLDKSLMGVYVQSVLSDFLTTGNRLCDAVKSCSQASKK